MKSILFDQENVQLILAIYGKIPLLKTGNLFALFEEFGLTNT